MHSRKIVAYTRRCTQWATLMLGGVTALIGIAAFTHADQDVRTLVGRLLPAHMQGQVRWDTVSAEQLHTGYTVQPNVNTILLLPEDMPRMSRRVLFGHRGDRVRYWGYCFPKDYDRARAVTASGLPGTVFLSEKERDIRQEQQNNERRDQYSIYEETADADTLNEERAYQGIIRHQQETFYPGTTCYVMTEEPLPVGTDDDGDLANAGVEREYRSDPQIADTDGDGIRDGVEIFRLGTDPLQRDSDGDGIIDGVEDANHNGRRDNDESDATAWDTDRDGLCDGLCKVEHGRKVRGEDKNLNGVLDDGETSPILVDTNSDGVLDFHEVYLCELAGGTDC